MRTVNSRISLRNIHLNFWPNFQDSCANSLHYNIITRHLYAAVRRMAAFQIPENKTSDRRRESDRRFQNRFPARSYAYLHAATGAVLSECLVKDISEIGARIILPTAARLPKQIMFRITGEVTPMSASVVWQAGTKCDLKFNESSCV